MRLRPSVLVAGGAILIVAVAVIVGVFRTITRPPEPPEKEKPGQEAPATHLEMEGLKLRDTDEQGRLKWEVESSGKLDVDPDTMTATGRDVKWVLVRGDGSRLVLQAPEFTASREQIALTKGVTARSSDGSLDFEASGVTFDTRTQHLHATGPLKAKVGDYELQADDLGFDRPSTSIRLVGHVVLGYQQYEVTAGAVSVEQSQRYALLTGGPRLSHADYSARADTIKVDGVKEEVRLIGKIRIAAEGLEARAARATLLGKQRRAELTGGVSISSDALEAQAQSLTIDFAATTVTLTGRVRGTASTRL
jgi:lipopolysaccharide assembly outer membrane protein LptD (OstA)